VESLVRRLRADGLAIEGVAPIGDVAPTLIMEAEQQAVDLIVMSTHALVGPKRSLLGSVADQVVRTAGCPVLLVRRSETMRESEPSEGAAAGPDFQVDEDTGTAAGIGGVVGAAIGSLAGGPIGAALGAAGGIVIGGGAEIATHAGGRPQAGHIHRWESAGCVDCGAPRPDEKADELPQR
jgi:hypothetical protein